MLEGVFCIQEKDIKMSEVGNMISSLKDTYRIVDGMRVRLDDKVIVKPEVFVDKMYCCITHFVCGI